MKKKPQELYEELIDDLVTKALEDGILTDDEAAIIDEVEIKLKEFYQYLEEALADNIMDKDETKKLKIMRSKILEDTWNVSNRDTIINKDEAELLKIIVKLLKNISEIDEE